MIAVEAATHTATQNRYNLQHGHTSLCHHAMADATRSRQRTHITIVRGKLSQ